MVGFARDRRRSHVPWQHRYWQWRGKVTAWAPSVLAILACWLLFVIAYPWLAEPAYILIAAARWSAATLLDAIGLGHLTWTIATNDGEWPWRSSFIHIDNWHLSQVEAVLTAVWTAMAWATGLTLLGLSLVSAWQLVKHRAVARYERRPAAPAGQHLAAADDDNRPGLPARARERPAALPDDQEQDQPADHEEEPDIEGLFRQDWGLEASEETRPRKPVARRKWDYRPC
jgi:hypothetical protein